MVMVVVMEKVTRHLLSGDRTLDLWTYPEATPADRVEGPALDRARIRLLLKRFHGLPPLQRERLQNEPGALK